VLAFRFPPISESTGHRWMQENLPALLSDLEAITAAHAK
jgi:hypothetical protein